MKDMKTYRVTAGVTISITTLVKALNASDARAIACDRPMLRLCHQCANGEDQVEWVTSGELDGDPVDLVVEEERR